MPPEAEATGTLRFEGVSLCIGSDHLAHIVQKVNNAIHRLLKITVQRIEQFVLLTTIFKIAIYLVDSIIQPELM